MRFSAGKGWLGPAADLFAFTRSIPSFGRTRRWATAALVDGFFVNMAALSRRQPYAQAHRHGVELERDVPYLNSGLEAHQLDMYRPIERHGALPVVLYVHGGGFRILSKESHWLMALQFARRGYLVFNINYRLAPAHRYPAAIEDVCAAYRWVVRNAAAFGGDPERIVLAGESAGANLVTALTVATTFARPEPWARQTFDSGIVPRAVLPACGVLQVSDPERLKRTARLSPFVFDYLQLIAEAYLPPPHALETSLDLADPLVVLERDTPSDRPLPAFFVQVGGRDPLVDDTQRLARALERRGVDVRAKVYPREPHAFHAYPWRRAARESWRDAFDFLGRRVSPPETGAVGLAVPEVEPG